jgi:hypothetical protein
MFEGPDWDTLSLRDQLLRRVRANDYVTFAELGRWFPAFRDGDQRIEFRDNLLLWEGVSEAGARALAELLEARHIVLYPANPLTYLIDGCSLALPLAKQVKAYAKPHWWPVTLRPVEQLKPRERALVRRAAAQAKGALHG